MADSYVTPVGRRCCRPRVWRCLFAAADAASAAMDWCPARHFCRLMPPHYALFAADAVVATSSQNFTHYNADNLFTIADGLTSRMSAVISRRHVVGSR